MVFSRTEQSKPGTTHEDKGYCNERHRGLQTTVVA
jgi:hypothetical protein